MFIAKQTNIAQMQSMAHTTVRGLNEASNMAGASAAQIMGILKTQLYSGTIIRSGAGLYDAEISTPANPRLACIQLSTIISEISGYGVTHAQLIPEGSAVYVWRPVDSINFGIIICAQPPSATPKFDGTASSNENRHVQMLDCEPGAADFTERAYKQLYSQNTCLTHKVNGGRPNDLMPGDISWINELGIGLAVRKLMTTIFASEKCKLELFLLDDLVRMSSGQFQHLSALGEQHIYNTNGKVTMELTGSSHQCEVSGFDKFGTAFASLTDFDMENARQCELKLAKDDQVLKRRFQMYLGHLGGIFNFFVAKPEVTSGTPNTYSAPSNDQGLAHVGVDANGTIMLRSAGDIILQRNDHIPVPKKLKEPWDPSGDGYKEESKKEPFKWGDDDPRARPAQTRDAVSWCVRSMYQPLIDNSDLQGKKDFHLPNENQLETPDNTYDELMGHLSDYAATPNKDKRSEIVLRKDGGITLREAKGAEISLINGRIIISAPGGVEIRSGQTALITGAEDVVIKAKDSVDITATKRDVRLKAENNLQMRAKGVLVEATGETETQNFDSKGEGIQSTGIILKAAKSRIFIWGNKVHLASVKSIIMEAMDTAGEVIMVCKDLIAAASNKVTLACGETSALLLSKAQALLHGVTTGCIGSSDAFLIRGDKYAVPIAWPKIGINPFDLLTENIKPVYNRYQTETIWLTPYTADERKKFKFTYRTEEQYGTDSGNFRLYASLWAYMHDNNDTWPETAIDETTAWPGKSHYDGATSLYRLQSESNISDKLTGAGKDWASRTANGPSFTKEKFDKYIG